MHSIPLAVFLFAGACYGFELVAVQSIFRHGDRAPSKPYPKDPIQANNWSNGLAQLTHIGVTQTQQLGSYYRRQYLKKLGQEVFVRSTSKKRAVDSAHNVLIGLFETTHYDSLAKIHVPVEYKNDLVSFSINFFNFIFFSLAVKTEQRALSKIWRNNGDR